MNPSLQDHPVSSREQWLDARRRLLAREKQLTRLRDQVAAERRELPWVRVDKDYRFQGERGERSLAELFGGNSQLIVYHFMFAPGWSEGCVGCSFLADHIDGANRHLAHHDVSLVAVSRAPLEEFQAFRRRMGWRFDWYSSYGSDFNRDFGVSFDKAQLAAGSIDYNYQPTPDAGEEMPGASVFLRNPAGEVFHTYSAYARGLDILLTTYTFLDLTPKGRNEDAIMDWLRHHDRYDEAPKAPAAMRRPAIEGARRAVAQPHRGAVPRGVAARAGDPYPPARRFRAGRGGLARRLHRRRRAVAARRYPAQPARLAGFRWALQGHRQPAPASAFRRLAATARRATGRAGRGAGGGGRCGGRRPATPDLHLLPPGADPRHRWR